MEKSEYTIDAGSVLELVSQMSFTRETGSDGEARGFQVIEDHLSRAGATTWFEEFPTTWVETQDAFLEIGGRRLPLMPVAEPVFNSPWKPIPQLVDQNGVLVDEVSPYARQGPQILLRTSLDKDAPCIPGASAQLFACSPEEGFVAYYLSEVAEPGGPFPSAYVSPEAVSFLKDCIGQRCHFCWMSQWTHKRLRNLVAEIRGTQRPEEVVAVGAHIDTFPGTVGADDNASGCARLVEFARWFLRNPPARTLRFIWLTGEELDRRGSNAYVTAHHQDPQGICLFVNVDGHVSVLHERLEVDIEDAGAVAQVVKEAIVPISGGRGDAPFKLAGHCSATSDAAAFNEMGIPAVFAPGGGERKDPGPHPHLPTDTVGRLEPENVRTASVVGLAFIDMAQKHRL